VAHEGAPMESLVVKTTSIGEKLQQIQPYDMVIVSRRTFQIRTNCQVPKFFNWNLGVFAK